jgi:hypothetical protein
MSWLRKLWWRLRDWWLGKRLLVNETRLDAAQTAVNRVVMETSLPPDCATGGPMRGGCAIQVKHDDAWEVFIHNTYEEAATEAIAWVQLQGSELEHRTASKLNRQQRRTFDAERTAKTKTKKKKKPQRQKKQRTRGPRRR